MPIVAPPSTEMNATESEIRAPYMHAAEDVASDRVRAERVRQRHTLVGLARTVVVGGVRSDAKECVATAMHAKRDDNQQTHESERVLPGERTPPAAA